MTSLAVQHFSHGEAQKGRPVSPRLIRILGWMGASAAGCYVASLAAAQTYSSVGGVTPSDIVLIGAISILMWMVCLLPLAWLIHGRIGRRVIPVLWHNVRSAAWRARDRWSGASSGSTACTSEASPATAFTQITETYYAPAVTHALDSHSASTASALIPTSEPATLAIPQSLRRSRPESLMLNGDVEPLESDGDALSAPWAVGAFFDVVQNGFTGVTLDSNVPLTTARKDVLDIGVRIAAEIVGTKIPARLRERLEQRQFLVTACVLKHYDMSAADGVRAMLTLRGYDPHVIWGAADAYLSGYYHCRSWDEARSMSARQLRLPPPPRV